MTTLAPLEALYDAARADVLPLPAALADLYGPLHPPAPRGRPYVIANFVSSLDGVVALDDAGRTGGGEISGHSAQDRMVMGLLRATADAVVVGAGTLRADPAHVWTAAHIYPPLADAYQALRIRLGKTQPPLNVIVSARGRLDLGLPVFQSGAAPVLVVTTPDGALHLREHNIPPAVSVAKVSPDAVGRIGARAILLAIRDELPNPLVLVEGGPHLMGDFFAEGCLDEQFLTLAPQVVGRDGLSGRPGLVAGRRLAPERPVWGELVSVRRGASHLFLRYAFTSSLA